VHADAIGLPRALTGPSGAVVWKANPARPYGDVQEVTTPDPETGRTVVTNLRLPGQYDERLLASVGLQGPYYNWNRWYLPSVGRYLELDPIAKSGGFNGFYGPNWYGYAEGNPLLWTDPRGLLPCSLGDTTYTCCLKKYPGCPECCGGEPPPVRPGQPPQPPKPKPTCETIEQPPPPDPVPKVNEIDAPGITAGICAGRCSKYPPVVKQACWAVCMAGGIFTGGL
jgi:RHS repeat-associated protein